MEFSLGSGSEFTRKSSIYKDRIMPRKRADLGSLTWK